VPFSLERAPCERRHDDAVLQMEIADRHGLQHRTRRAFGHRGILRSFRGLIEAGPAWMTPEEAMLPPSAHHDPLWLGGFVQHSYRISQRPSVQKRGWLAR
jgi:hypothetical protein